MLNKTVDVKSYGADRNGRTLGEVFLLDGKNVNIEMVQAGLAECYRGRPASGLDMGPYWKAEEEAKAAKRGMWELGDKYVSPEGVEEDERELDHRAQPASAVTKISKFKLLTSFWIESGKRLFRILPNI